MSRWTNLESKIPTQANNSRRFWLAVALAPLSVLVFETVRNSWDDGILRLNLEHMLLYALFSYAGMLIFGLPYAFVLRLKDKLTFVALIIGGLIAGPLYIELLNVVLFGHSAKLRHLYSEDMILPAFLSGTVAAVFGLIARARIR